MLERGSVQDSAIVQTKMSIDGDVRDSLVALMSQHIVVFVIPDNPWLSNKSAPFLVCKKGGDALTPWPRS